MLFHRNQQANGLDDFIAKMTRPLVKRDPFFHMMIFGPLGGGKSWLSMLCAIGVYQRRREFQKERRPLLLVNTEESSKFLVEHFEKADIPVQEATSTSPADWQKFMDACNAGMFAGLIGDSFTHPWYSYVREYCRQNKITAPRMQDWQKIQLPWRAMFSERLRKARYDYILCGRAGFEYEREEDEETGKKQFVKSGVKAKLEGETGNEPDIVIYTERQQEIEGKDLLVWRQATILKDRSGILEGKTFKNADWKIFSPIFESLIKGAVTTEPMPEADPKDAFENPDRVPAAAIGKSRDVLVDSIEKELTLAFPGTAVAATQMRLRILKDVFNTPSLEALRESYMIYPASKSENPGPNFVISLEDGLMEIRNQLANLLASAEAGKGEDSVPTVTSDTPTKTPVMKKNGVRLSAPGKQPSAPHPAEA